MNYTPLTEVTEAGFFELFAMTFDSGNGIFMFVFGMVFLIAIGAMGIDLLRDGSHVFGSLSVIGALIIGGMSFLSGAASGYEKNLGAISLENVSKKYEITELLDFEREIPIGMYIYNGHFYDTEKNLAIKLSINVDKDTGEPKIMQNAQINEEFITSLERNK